MYIFLHNGRLILWFTVSLSLHFRRCNLPANETTKHAVSENTQTPAHIKY